jgi:hypothetical protein
MFRYGTVDFLRHPLPSLGGSRTDYPAGFGWELPVVYMIWLLVVALMYAPALLFARLKERRRSRWLSYF